MAESGGFERLVPDLQDVDYQEGSETQPLSSPQIAPQGFGITDPELTQLVEKWSELPPVIKKGIIAMVGGV